MKVLKQALGVLGALVIVAIIAAFVAPRKAHALAAALVQIVPGTTTHVGQNESQLVSLICRSGSDSCVTIEPDASQSSTAYVVPSGSTLIVTDYESTGSTSPAQAGVLFADFFFNANTGSAFALSEALTDQNGKFDIRKSYLTGIRVESGVTIADINAVEGTAFAFIQGYLVPND
jgi:hypothetical protein